MKSDEALLLFGLVFLALPVCVWFFQDDIFAFLQMVDTAILTVFSFIPFVGDYYGNVGRAYSAISPDTMTWRHAWIAGQITWRPIAVLVFFPMMLRWAWKARKKRRAQSFNNINKAYMLKHCGTVQTSPDSGARQQWVVRRWYQHFDLHRMPWGSAQWHIRLRQALVMQLGKPSDHPEAQALLKDFADFINKEIRQAFGDAQANQLSAKDMVAEATASHAYCATAAVRILAAARDQFGVVSPQGFRNRLFQKAETVPIWFSLNGLSRQTTHAESLGVLSHFYMEVAEREPQKEPRMENAIAGLEKYREHLMNQRKLGDLDESAAYAEKARRLQNEASPQEATPNQGYQEDEQVLN